MKGEFTINRNGTFKAALRSKNQCKAPGHKSYDYTVRVRCGTRLDHSNFVIDHSEIDKSIQTAARDQGSNSCEIFCIVLASAVLDKMESHGCLVSEVYIRVKPKVRKEVAFMEYTLNNERA